MKTNKQLDKLNKNFFVDPIILKKYFYSLKWSVMKAEKAVIV